MVGIWIFTRLLAIDGRKMGIYYSCNFSWSSKIWKKCWNEACYRQSLSRWARAPGPFKMPRPLSPARAPPPGKALPKTRPALPPALRSGGQSRESGCGAQLRAVMVAPMYGSPGGRLARALALALVLALLVGLFLSGLTSAIPTPKGYRGSGRSVPPASRSRSVLLDTETGQLRLVDGRHPDAVAWANLTNAIHENG